MLASHCERVVSVHASVLYVCMCAYKGVCLLQACCECVCICVCVCVCVHTVVSTAADITYFIITDGHRGM